MSDYGVKDIKTLEGIEAIRLRPGIVLLWSNFDEMDCCFNRMYIYFFFNFPLKPATARLLVE